MGLTPGSSTAEQVLRSIAEQCCALFGEHPAEAAKVMPKGEEETLHTNPTYSYQAACHLCFICWVIDSPLLNHPLAYMSYSYLYIIVVHLSSLNVLCSSLLVPPCLLIHTSPVSLPHWCMGVTLSLCCCLFIFLVREKTCFFYILFNLLFFFTYRTCVTC